VASEAESNDAPQSFVDQVRNAAMEQFSGPEDVLQAVKAPLRKARTEEPTLLRDNSGACSRRSTPLTSSHSATILSSGEQRCVRARAEVFRGTLVSVINLVVTAHHAYLGTLRIRVLGHSTIVTAFS
jgi:hypothetical protein